MLKLIIGNKAYSSWSLRGWLACKQSALPFETLVLPLYDDAWAERRTQADLAPSGGKVPILWDDEIAVWDSLAIIDYLDAQSGGNAFWPQSPSALALARSLCAEMHSGYAALRSQHSMNVRRVFEGVIPSEDVAADVKRIAALWISARTRFGKAGPYLFGDFGAADIMFAPVVTRLVSYQLPYDAAAKPYVEAIMSHPWIKEWIAAAEAEEWIIDRFEPDEPRIGFVLQRTTS
jgi:glutathione S-transferase